jgi:predicted nucleic acid-binding protein
VITVSNTTPIISLSSIGKIEILRDIFEEIIIPQAVYDEIKSKYDGYGYNEVDLAFIKIETVKNTEFMSHFLDINLKGLNLKGQTRLIFLTNKINWI